MKRIFIATICFLSFFLSAFAAPGELISNPTVPTTKNSITLIYEPSVSQNWMKTQDVFIYVCLEMDQNGEWVKEKAEWSKSDLPNFKWVKGTDGKLTYTISNIKTYFNLTDADMSKVSGLFVILKNDKYQTTDKYVKIESKESKQEKFQGNVSFNVTVPEGTKQVYVAGTFAEQGSPLYWKHADEKLKLTQKDATHFYGTIKNVPADLQYLYVYGERVDQAEFRMGHRPLGGKTKVTDIVEYWGDMTLNVTVPKGTNEVYVSGNFNNWGFSLMTDIGNNTWIYHVAPTKLGADEQIEYKYFTKAEKQAVEKRADNRKISFTGFASQYDEIKAW